MFKKFELLRHNFTASAPNEAGEVTVTASYNVVEIGKTVEDSMPMPHYQNGNTTHEVVFAQGEPIDWDAIDAAVLDSEPNITAV